MGQYFVNELKVFQPKNVYTAFSGGGIYIYLHHGLWTQMLKDAKDQDWAVFLITETFNSYPAKLLHKGAFYGC